MKKSLLRVFDGVTIVILALIGIQLFKLSSSIDYTWRSIDFNIIQLHNIALLSASFFWLLSILGLVKRIIENPGGIYLGFLPEMFSYTSRKHFSSLS
jgi:hypothetical protein